MSQGSDHWLDRAALRRVSRASFLRSAAVVGAALILPFGRPAAGRAAGSPDPCLKGCNAAVSLKFGAEKNRCKFSAAYWNSYLLVGFLWVNPLIGGAVVVSPDAPSCIDEALIRAKARAWDCLQPDCPGFDPSDLPVCDGCPTSTHGTPQAGEACCPTTSGVYGYVCCAQCCSPTGDGCGSGTTQCGGG